MFRNCYTFRILFIFLVPFCFANSAESHISGRKSLDILFLGPSGAGKSATINTLLGREVAEVRAKTKEVIPTKTIVEYTLSGENEDDDPENSEDPGSSDNDYSVRFIDTPGIGSIKGVVHESRVLATIRKYLRERESPPSVILIFSKFDDNRVEGEHSNFVKMLKKYNDLENVYTRPDTPIPPIIFVFTHFLGVTKKEQRNPKPKISTFSDIIQNYTTFPHPIVISLAENEAEDEELDFDEDLGSHKLPNKEFYPENLINKILDAVSNSSTTSEMNAYKNILKNRRDLNYETTIPLRVLTTDEISTDELENDLQDKLKHLQLQKSGQSQTSTTEGSQQSYETETSTPTEPQPDDITAATATDTDITTMGTITESELETTPRYPSDDIAEISNELSECGDNDELDESDSELLQKILTDRNLKEMSQLPKNREEIIRFFKDVPLSEKLVNVFERCLFVSIPELDFDDIIVGHGYDILKNLPLGNTPFEIKKLKYSELGFKIPEWISNANIDQEELVLQNYFSNRGDFLNARLRNLSLDNSQANINANEYEPKFTTGNNIFEMWTNEESVKITTLREYRLFSWTLKDNTIFNDDFLETIAELPELDVHNKASVNEWTSLFETYGTHIVSFAYGGGSLETHNFIKRADIDEMISRHDLLNPAGSISVPDPTNNFTSQGELTTTNQDKLKFNGGQYKYRYVNLYSPETNDSVLPVYNTWHQSLSTSPIILETNLKLTPLSQIINGEYPKISQEMDRAAKLYLAGSLIYTRYSESTTLAQELQKTMVTTLPPILIERTPEEIMTTKYLPKTTQNPFPYEYNSVTASRYYDNDEYDTRFPVTTLPKPLTTPFTPPQPITEKAAPPRKITPKTPQELIFQSQVDTIKKIVLTVKRTCIVSLDHLKISTESHSSLLISIFGYLNGLIHVVDNSEIFCRNRNTYSELLIKIKHTILNEQLSNENLREIYAAIEFSFSDSPAFQCQRRVSLSHTSEFQGSNIGHGYNVLTAVDIPKTPFDTLNEHISCDNVYSPDATTSVDYTYKTFANIHSYSYNFRQEFQKQSPGETLLDIINFKNPFPPGINFKHCSFPYISWLEEHKTFSVRLSTKNITLNSEFIESVHRLRQVQDFQRPTCLAKTTANKWKELFNNYGTHIIQYSNVGGALKITPNFIIWDKHLQYVKADNAVQILTKINRDHLGFCAHGGNTTALNESGLNKNSIALWKNSLYSNPELLQSNLALVPIIDYVKLLRPDLTATADIIMKSVYACHFTSPWCFQQE